jgi:hypothetical protein
VNVLARNQGRRVFDQATAEVRAFVEKQGTMADQLESVLESAPDAEECLAILKRDVVAAATAADAETACGRPPLTVSADEEYAALRDKFDEIRDDADRSYVSLDLRADFGDPTNSDDATGDGEYVSAALAAGRRFTETLSVRGALGIRYFSLDEVPEGMDRDGFSVEFFGGLEWNPGDQVRVSVGLESRKSASVADMMADAADADLVDVRIGISVPLADGKALSVAIAKPLGEDAPGPSMTIAGDWSLLAGSLGGK